MMTGVGASLPSAAGSPARAFFDDDMPAGTSLDEFEAEAADRHGRVPVPISPPGSPVTLDAVMAQMAVMIQMLKKMAEDGEETKQKVRALEALVKPGADPWQPGLAAGLAGRSAVAGGSPAAPPGMTETAEHHEIHSREQSDAGSQDGATVRGQSGWTMPELIRIP